MNIADFLGDVRLDAPGCPDFLSKKYLLHALREFCESSKVWQEDLSQIDLVSGIPSYDIDTPVDSELVAVLSGRYADAQFERIYTPEEMNRTLITWRTDTGTGVSYLVQDASTLYVSPIPSAANSTPIYLRAALKPTLTATTCADILDQWREGIAAGTLARLKRIPNKEWSDREGVPAYLAEFERAKRRALIRVLNGFNDRDFSATPQVY